MTMNLLFALPAGLLGDRIGYKRGLLIGTFLTIASIVGIALSSSSSGLIAFLAVLLSSDLNNASLMDCEEPQHERSLAVDARSPTV